MLLWILRSSQEYKDLESYQMAVVESYQKADVPDGNDDNFEIDEEENLEERSDEEPRMARQPLVFHQCLKYLSERAAEGQRRRIQYYSK